ncbi:AAA family ATPase [Candidatus Halobeggiatoa sp. HSG11]|nr:AAA family ATPase [Candidatus Halobeggiatoa sp. HSG11]
MNPFDPKNPADKTNFAGRENELEEIKKSFELTFNGKANHLLLKGERGIGKTSILKHIQDEYENQQALIVFSRLGHFESMTELVKDIIANFYDTVEKKASENTLQKVTAFLSKTIKGVEIGGIGVSFRSENNIEETIAPNFAKVLMKFWDEIRDDFKSLVIIIDETDRLGIYPEFAVNFSLQMRSIIEEVDPQIKIIMSAIPEVVEEIQIAHESLIRTLNLIDVSRFTEKSVINVLEKGLDSSSDFSDKKEYDEEFAHLLVKQSDGIPYYVQAICCYAFDFDSDNILTEEDFRESLFGHDNIKGVIELLSVYPFDNMIKNAKSASSRSLEILQFIAEKGGTATLDELDESLPKDPNKDDEQHRGSMTTIISRLRAVGFIQPPELSGQGVYTFSTNLARIWVDKVLREIPDSDIEWH